MKVGITGHQNLPKSAIPFIKKEVRKVLDKTGDKVIGVSSLAAGADQLFAKIILEISGHLQVIVPCHNYEETFSNKTDLNQFITFLDKAESIEELKFEEPSEEAFLQAGKRVTDLSDILVAVWDGLKPKGKGGTADIVKYAESGNKTVFIIWPEGAKR